MIRHFRSTPAGIPPLVSGGLMLTYRCTNRCRHCLYRCSFHNPDVWMTDETLARVLAALQEEPQLHGIHLAGGEAMLRPDRVVQVVREATRAGIGLDYLETNAAWCGDAEETRDTFARLRDAGLPAVLISVSPFHNEFVSFRRTRLAIEAATGVFGRGGVIVWVPAFYNMLAGLDDDGTHTFEQFCDRLQLEPAEVPRMYGVVPGGRVPEALRECYEAYPAERFAGECCAGELLNTTHFHIDPDGNLFTGLCAGLAPAAADNLHPALDPEAFPVFCTLLQEGPWGLVEAAGTSAGFTPRASGYVSKCDLCYDVRCSLHATGDYPELRPDSYYTAD